jgi:general secretion pathway protein D
MRIAANNHNNQKHGRRQLIFFWTLLLISGSTLWGQEQTSRTNTDDPNLVPSKIALNFQEVPLRTVLEYLSETTGLVVVSDEPMDGRMTVISKQAICLEEAISLINSVLKENNLAAVRTGRTLRIVTLQKAKTMNIPVTSGNDPDAIVPGDDMVTHVIQIRHADAVKLKENLQSLIPEYASLEANQDGNALIVTDTTANIKRLMEIIRALDTHMATVAEIKVFHLQSADASNTADLINSIFQQEQQSSEDVRAPGGPFEMMGRMRGRDRRSDEGEQSEGGAGVRVVAAADERTNSVVVSGPGDTLEVVAEVVQALDSRSAAVADVKVFHLEYADAENTAELINEVFGEDRGSSRSQSRAGGFLAFRRGPFGSEQTDQSSKSGSVIEVVAAADERTNSIVVSGPSDTLEVIAAIIKDLDVDPEQERQVFVYPLKNAEASNLKEILNNLFSEMQSLNEQGSSSTGQRFQGPAMGPGAQTSQDTGNGDLSDEAYFEADEQTNSLLVMTSSKNYTKIKPIIKQLDKPLGQVLIKVLFAEVTHSDSVDLGTEFSVLNMRSDGDSTLFSTDFGIASQSSGLVVKAVEGDLTMTLRALQEVGKLNILSRPYILTSDNQTATITVGEEVPFIRNTRTTETGQTINTIEYEDIGIILEVTPSINPEGLVTMDVTPEISATTGKTVPISEAVNAAVFAKRSSQTRVVVRDGQTIVIGGLIEDESTETVRKVPLIGDIPILGALFQRTVQDKSKTELLIFLTPRVATKAEELTAISEAEKSRSNIGQTGPNADTFKKHMEGMQAESNSEER